MMRSRLFAIAAALGLLLTETFLGAHVPGLPADPLAILGEGQPLPGTPRTGVQTVDAILKEARAMVASSLHDMESLLENLSLAADAASHVEPSRNFREGVAEDGTIGGFGGWTSHVAGTEGRSVDETTAWHTTDVAAAAGDWSFAPTRADGTYPLGSRLFLVSPRVDLTTVAFPHAELRTLLEQVRLRFSDLRSLSGTAWGEPDVNNDGTPEPNPLPALLNVLESCTVSAIAAARTQGLVRLSFLHRFSLAAGFDFGRLWIAREAPSAVLDESKLLPLDLSGVTTGTPRALDPCLDTDRLIDALPADLPNPLGLLDTDPLVRALGREAQNESHGIFTVRNRLTGAQSEWERLEVDLTGFAGENVWIVFELESSKPNLKSGTWFSSEQRFPERRFFGWWLDEIEVRAPAHPFYIRFTAALEPHHVREGRRVVAPGASVPFSVEVHNAGALNQSVRVGAADSRRGLGIQGPFLIEPAATRRVTFEWTAPAATDVDDLLFAVILDAAAGDRGDPDGHRLPVPVRVVAVKDASMAVVPERPVGDVGELRSVVVSVTNTGTLPLTEATYTAELVRLGSNVVVPVLFQGPRGPPSLAPMERVETEHAVFLSSVGAYRLTVRLVELGVVVAEASATLNARTTPNTMFRDDFTLPPSGIGFQPTLSGALARAVTGDPLATAATNTWRVADPARPETGTYWAFGLRGADPTSRILQASVLNPELPRTNPDTLNLDDLHGFRLQFQERVLMDERTGSSPTVVVWIGPLPRASNSVLEAQGLYRLGQTVVYQRTVPRSDSLPGQALGRGDLAWRTVDIDVTAPIVASLARTPDSLAVLFQANLAQSSNPDGLTPVQQHQSWLLTDIRLTAKRATGGEEVVLLRSDGDAGTEIGHWQGWRPSTSAALFIGTPQTIMWTRESYGAPRTAWAPRPNIGPPGTANAMYNGNAATFQYASRWIHTLYSPVVDLSASLEPSLNLTHKWAFDMEGAAGPKDLDKGRVGYQVWDGAAFSPTYYLLDVGQRSPGFDFTAPRTCATPSGLDGKTSVEVAPYVRQSLDLQDPALLAFDPTSPHTSLNGKVVRFVFETVPADTRRVPPSIHANRASGSQGCGWFLGTVRIDGARMFATDLSVDEVRVEAPFDAFAIGLPPDVQVPLAVTVRNKGLFDTNAYQLRVQFLDTGFGVRSTHLVSRTTSLSPSSNETVRINVGPPPVGEYFLRLEALPASEEFPEDNLCYASASGVCDVLADPEPLLVAAFVDGAIEADGSPLSGSPDQSRFLVATIRNDGNVALTGILVRRTIDSLAAGFHEEKDWLVAGPLAPGQATLLHVAEPAYDQDLWWQPPEQTGDFTVRFELLVPGERTPTTNLRVLRLGSFSPFFDDRLEGGRSDSGFFAGDWRPDPGWVVANGAGYGSRRAWRVGQGDPLQVPSSAEAILRLPTMNLAAASSASLSFVHRFELEEGFDAGLVEGSTDGGATWQLLQPRESTFESAEGSLVRASYPARVASSSRLVPDHDPTRVLHAYSGDLVSFRPAEFNLGQLGGLTRNEEFRALTAGPGFLTLEPGVVGNIPGDPRAYREGSWGWIITPSGVAQEGWQVQDGRVLNPLSREAPGRFAWSDSSRDAGLGFSTSMKIASSRTDLTDVDAGYSVRLGFFEKVMSGGGTRQILVEREGTNLPPEPVTAVASRFPGLDGWTFVVANLDRFAGSRVDITFAYREPTDSRFANAGWAIDDVTVVSYRAVGGQQLDRTVRLDERFNGLAPQVTFHCDSCAGVTGFALVESIPAPSPSPWNPVPSASGKAWRFGGTSDGPNSADARLVTPPLDLSGIGGVRAQARLLHQYDFETSGGQGLDGGWLEIQARDASDPTRWGPWTPLVPVGGYPRAAFPQALLGADRVFAGNSGLVAHTFDLSAFIGQEVRIGMRAVTGPRHSTGTQSWTLHSLSVGGEVFVGGDVDLRVRLGTDRDVNEGHWTIDNVSVSGQTYVRNVGIFLDGDALRRTDASGGVVEVTGVVRNLGTDPQPNLHLRAEGDPGLGLRLDPASGFLPAASRGPFSLQSVDLAGNQTTFRLQVQLPSGAALRSVRLQLVRGPAGTTLGPITDNQIAGVLAREVQFDSSPLSDPIVFDALTAAETVVSSGVPTRLVGAIRNAGPDAIPVESSLYVDGELVAQDDLLLPPGPCPLTLCGWDVAFSEAGFHRVSLRLSDLPGPTASLERGVSFAVDTAFIYHRNAFETPKDLEAWDTAPPDSPSSINAAHVGETDGDPTTNTDTLAEIPFQFAALPGRTGPFHLLAGVAREEWLAGAAYPDFGEGHAASDPIDLRFVPPDAGILSLWHMPRFNRLDGGSTPGYRDGGVVEVCLRNPLPPFACQGRLVEGTMVHWFRLYPEGGYGHEGPDQQAQRPWSPHGLGPALTLGSLRAGVPLASGFAEDWQRLEFDLANQSYPGRLEQPPNAGPPAERIPILGSLVSFRLRMGSWDHRSAVPRVVGQGWLVDDLQVSGYRARIAPESQELRVRDGVLKDVQLLVENRGAGTDTFDVRVLDEALPQGVLVTDSPPLRLAPGERRVATLQVAFPVDAGIEVDRSISLVVEARSRADPSMAASARVVFLLGTERWPDLGIRGIQGPSPVRAGVPATFLVTIDNTGTRDAPPALVTVTGHAENGTMFPIASLRTAKALAPGGFLTLPIEWTPDRGLDATIEMRVHVNAAQEFLELPFQSNEAIRQVRVALLPRPDLEAGAISLLSAEALGPARRIEGELVRFQASVTNVGTGAALGSEAELVLDNATLRSVSLPRLEPLQSAMVEANWPAKSGNHTLELRLRVGPGQVEWSDANNREGVRFFVSRGGVAVQAPNVSVRPGEAADAAMRITNQGNLPQTLTASVTGEPGWGLRVLPEEVVLAPGASVEFRLEVQAPRHALAGLHPVELVLREASDDAVLRRVTVPVLVAAHVSGLLTVGYQPSATEAGSLAVAVRNTANAPMRAHLRLEGPPAWGVGSGRLIDLAVGEAGLVELPVDAPSGAPPGSYMLDVVLVSDCCEIQRTTVQIDVPSSPRVRLVELRRSETPNGIEALLKLSNVGNVASEIRLAAEDAGPALRFSENPVRLGPGESVLVRAAPIAAGDDGTATVHASAAGAVASLRLHAAPPTRSPRIARAEPHVQAQGMAARSFEIEVSGLAPGSSAQVALYVDGSLLDVRATGPADDSGHAVATLAWRASSGRHLLTFEVDPKGLLPDDDRSDNLWLEDVLVPAQAAGAASGVGLPGLLLGILSLLPRLRPRFRMLQSLRAARPLFLITLLLPWAALASGQAGPSAPWWEPGPMPAPGNLSAGWNFRVFLSATNPHPAPVTNMPAYAELDLGALVVASGWPSRRSGDRLVPAGFTLDEDSFRLFQYSFPAFSAVGAEVPVRFEPHWRRQPQGGVYDPSVNPIGTLTWIVAGSLEASASRGYVLYFDALENAGGKSAPPLSNAAIRALDSQAEPGRGTLFFAASGLAPINRLRFTPLVGSPRLTVYEITGDFARLHKDPGGAPNPFLLTSAKTYDVQSGRLYRIESDRPILAALECRMAATVPPVGGVAIPSTDGRLVGGEFRLDGWHPSVTVLNPRLELDPPSLEVTTSAGTSTIPPSQWSGDSVRLESATRIRVLGGRDALVRAVAGTADPLQPLVDETGASVGNRLLGLLPPAGNLLAGTLDASASAAVHRLDTFAKALPSDSSTYTLPAFPDASLRAATGQQVPSHTGIDLVPTTYLEDRAAGLDRRLFAYAGADGAPLGASPPHRAGTDFWVLPEFGVDVVAFAALPETGIEVEDLSKQTERSLLLAENQTVPLARGGPFRIHSSKPIVVEPVVGQSACGRYLAGLDDGATVAQLGIERRGYALRLSAVEPAGDPATLTAAPGEDALFRLRLENHARWTGNQRLPDAARLSAVAPVGWTVEVGPPLLQLAGGASVDVEVRIRPPPESPPGTQGLVRIVATSQGNPQMSDEARLVTFVRLVRGVDLWFGRNLQFPGPDSFERRIDPGANIVYDLVVKNTGGATDSFRLGLSDAPTPWSADLTLRGSSVRQVTLAAGEARLLEVRIASPTAPGDPLVTDITAVSQSSDEATAKARAITRLRTRLDLELSSAPQVVYAAPGTEARFPTQIANRGRTTLDVGFRLEWVPAPGWSNASLIQQVSLEANSSFPVPVRVSVPSGALTTEAATLRLVAFDAADPASPAQEDLVLRVQVLPRGDLFVNDPGAFVAVTGTRLNASLVVRNDANSPQRVFAELVEAPAGVRWQTQRVIVLAPGAVGTLNGSLEVAPGAGAGLFPIRLRVIGTTSSVNVSSSITVRERHSIELEAAATTLRIAAGGTAALRVTVANRGNVPELVRVEAIESSGRIRAAALQLRLGPNESAERTLLLAAPANETFNGTLTVLARSAEGAADSLTIPVSGGSPDLRLADVEAAVAGFVRARIHNAGGFPARGILVEARGAKGVVDRVTVGFLQSGDERVVLLHVPTHAPVDVEVDPAQAQPDADRSNNFRRFEPELALGDANASAAGALMALGAIVVAVRRRRA